MHALVRKCSFIKAQLGFVKPTPGIRRAAVAERVGHQDRVAFTLVLKQTADTIAGPLRAIFQHSLDTGDVPQAWKRRTSQLLLRKAAVTIQEITGRSALRPSVAKQMQGAVKADPSNFCESYGDE